MRSTSARTPGPRHPAGKRGLQLGEALRADPDGITEPSAAGGPLLPRWGCCGPGRAVLAAARGASVPPDIGSAKGSERLYDVALAVPASGLRDDLSWTWVFPFHGILLASEVSPGRYGATQGRECPGPSW